jgi:AraC-like DNA-binding protein
MTTSGVHGAPERLALLGERRLSIAEVAYLLGFSDKSALYRAFKR